MQAAFQLFQQLLIQLNFYQGLLTAISTCAIAYLTYKLMKETRRIRELNSEPNIEVFIVPDERSSAFINMVIRNCGGGPARDIKWNIIADKDNVEQKKITILKMSLFNVLHYISAGEEFRFYFGSSFDLLKDPKMKPITIEVSYANALSKNRQNKSFIIDIQPWEGMVVLGKPSLDEISDSLKQLHKCIDKFFGSTPLLVRVQNENEYQIELDARRKADEES